MKVIITGLVLAFGLVCCSAQVSCGADNLPHPQSVTLVRVDGGFMSCTTFIEADSGME